MNYMPQMKDLLRTGEKQDALGKRGFLACRCDGPFEGIVMRLAQPAEAGKLFSPTKRAAADGSDAQWTHEVEGHHVCQCRDDRIALDSLRAGQAEERSQSALRQQFLLNQALRKAGL